MDVNLTRLADQTCCWDWCKHRKGVNTFAVLVGEQKRTTVQHLEDTWFENAYVAKYASVHWSRVTVCIRCRGQLNYDFGKLAGDFDSCPSVFTRRDHHQVSARRRHDRSCCVGSCMSHPLRDQSVLVQAGPLLFLPHNVCSNRADLDSLCWRLSVSKHKESARPHRIQRRTTKAT